VVKCYEFLITDKQLSCHPQDPIRRAAESLKSGLDGIVEDFRSRYSIVPLKSHHTVLLRYEEGNKFSNHIDAHPEFPGVVSVSMFLNDDFEGGDLEFKEFGIKIKPDAGDVIVFCSSFPYMHQVHPVEVGIRYAVVKWYQWT
jgi:predicted 2-oxoglutarate/Fe(II)-dependent dioxygenase YbiX